MNRRVSIGWHDDRVQQRLFRAIRDGDIDTVRKMVDEYGAKAVLSMNLRGEVVLQAAVNSGQTEMLKFLLSLDGAADLVNEPLWNGDTLLHLSTNLTEEHVGPIVRILMEHGANPDSPDWNQLCVLDRAIIKDKPEIARAVITYGNNPERTARLASKCLKMAEQEGMDRMASIMTDLMESFDKSDPEFGLYNAIISNDHKRIHDLFFRHVDPFAVRFGVKKMSALHAAARQRDIRVLAMLLAKIDKIGRVDAVDWKGRTPLHYAAAKNNVLNVDWLLFVGADPRRVDKEHQLPEHLTSSRVVIDILTTESTYSDKIPDAIVLMHGDWLFELPRSPCTLSRSATQPPDSVFPPVLLFRCITGDDSDELMEEFESSTFEIEQTCLEVYEYRCSQPSDIFVIMDVTRYDYHEDDTTLFFQCTNDWAKVLHTVELEVSQGRKGSCEVPLLKSGMLVLMCRREHRVVSVPVGPGPCLIDDDELGGFELEVPPDTFQEDQHIMIKVSEQPHLPQEHNQEAEPSSKISTSEIDNDEFFPIKTISCFYSIMNTGEEKPHKSLNMKIPLEITKDSNVVTLARCPGRPQPDTECAVQRETSHDSVPIAEGNQTTAAREETRQTRQEISIGESGEVVTVAKYDDDDNDNEEENEEDFEVFEEEEEEKEECRDDSDHSSEAPEEDFNKKSSLLPPMVSHGEQSEATRVTEPVWRVTKRVSGNPHQTAVNAIIQDIGVVVAAEVEPGVTEAEIIQAIEMVFSRQSKMEILLFAMTKPYPGGRVEVIVCCVSGERYEDTVTKLQNDGYKGTSRQPKVAYAFKREVFSLKLKGNFTDMYMDSEPILEYQVGGRLNFTSFVLELSDKEKPALGAIEVIRQTTQNSVFSSVDLIPLDLTMFFAKPSSPRSKRVDRQTSFSRGRTVMDKVVWVLSQELSSDNMRIYCHALGLTREAMKSVCDQGQSFSPTERNFRMLSKTRSRFRSEPAFCKHLKDVLQRHNEIRALELVNSILKG